MVNSPFKRMPMECPTCKGLLQYTGHNQMDCSNCKKQWTIRYSQRPSKETISMQREAEKMKQKLLTDPEAQLKVTVKKLYSAKPAEIARKVT